MERSPLGVLWLLSMLLFWIAEGAMDERQRTTECVTGANFDTKKPPQWDSIGNWKALVHRSACLLDRYDLFSSREERERLSAALSHEDELHQWRTRGRDAWNLIRERLPAVYHNKTVDEHVKLTEDLLPLIYTIKTLRPCAGGIKVCSLLRDDGRSIVEWILFHLFLGVDFFQLWIINSRDSTWEAVRPFANAGVVSATVISTTYRTEHAELLQSARQLCLTTAKEAGDQWLAFLDPDEYLFPDNQGCLMDLMEPFKDHPAVAVNLEMVNMVDRTFAPRPEKGSETDLFLLKEGPLRTRWSHGVKHIYNIRMTTNCATEPCTFEPSTALPVDQNLRPVPHPYNANPMLGPARLRWLSFTVKSVEDLMVKRALGLDPLSWKVFFSERPHPILRTLHEASLPRDDYTADLRAAAACLQTLLVQQQQKRVADPAPPACQPFSTAAPSAPALVVATTNQKAPYSVTVPVRCEGGLTGDGSEAAVLLVNLPSDLSPAEAVHVMKAVMKRNGGAIVPAQCDLSEEEEQSCYARAMVEAIVRPILGDSLKAPAWQGSVTEKDRGGDGGGRGSAAVFKRELVWNLDCTPPQVNDPLLRGWSFATLDVRPLPLSSPSSANPAYVREARAIKTLPIGMVQPGGQQPSPVAVLSKKGYISAEPSEATAHRRVIFTIFGGRRANLLILLQYVELLVRQGLVHGVHLWDFTLVRNEVHYENREYIWELAKELPWLTVFSGAEKEMETEEERPHWWFRYYSHYKSDKYKGSVIIKCDDDVNFIDTESFGAFIRHRVAHPYYLLAFPAIINNGVMAHYLQSRGILPMSHFGPLPYDTFYGQVVTNGTLGEMLHDYFLDNMAPVLRALRRDPKPLIHHPMGHRFSINMYAVNSEDLDGLFEFVNDCKDDELCLTEQATVAFSRPNLVVLSMAVAHISFHTQRKLMDVDRIVRRYADRAGLWGLMHGLDDR